QYDLVPRKESLHEANFQLSTPSTSITSNQDQETRPKLPVAMATYLLHPPYHVDPDGDVLLFTPKTPLIDIHKGNVPGNYARFQVSSKNLALASGYLKRTLKSCWAEGHAPSTKGSAEIPVNYWKPDILLIILNLIHGRLRQIPLRLSLPQLSDIAVATDYFQCHEVVEVFAEDTKTWVMISCVFKSPDIFKQTTRIAMEQATGPFDTSNLPIPKSVKDAIDQARQECVEKFELMIKEHMSKLFNGPTYCSAKCDATQLALFFIKMMKKEISYSLDMACSSESSHVRSITVDIWGHSPEFIHSMIKE
ncbi:hypothetical protein N7517_004078, partial [Penicillium concentricum]